jgi:hypothetical protein
MSPTADSVIPHDGRIHLSQKENDALQGAAKTDLKRRTIKTCIHFARKVALKTVTYLLDLSSLTQVRFDISIELGSGPRPVCDGVGVILAGRPTIRPAKAVFVEVAHDFAPIEPDVISAHPGYCAGDCAPSRQTHPKNFRLKTYIMRIRCSYYDYILKLL